MLAIRLQRTGRKGHAQFRVVVQDARLTPTSGKVVALLGNYNPHTKEAALAKDKAEFYLTNGAQPSPRVARLFKAEGISLPNWVKESGHKKRTLRNPEKLRKNRSADAEAPKEESPTEGPVNPAPETPQAEESAAEKSSESVSGAVVESSEEFSKSE